MTMKILIVEDHDATRQSLRDWLEAVFPRCRVVEAPTGERAVVLARAESPQLVVMDISLPGMDGVKATRRIKAALPAAHVVMLSIHEDGVYRAAAFAAGASAFVPKRKVQSELLPTLSELLSVRSTPERV
jgi:DNA-binding NarL/FixJ family response regulator